MAEESAAETADLNEESIEPIQEVEEEAAGETHEEAPDAAEESAAAPEEHAPEDRGVTVGTPVADHSGDADVAEAAEGGDAAEATDVPEPTEEGEVAGEKSEVTADDARTGSARVETAEGEAGEEDGQKQDETTAEHGEAEAGEEAAAGEAAAAAEVDEAHGEGDAVAATTEGEEAEGATEPGARLPTSEDFATDERSESPPRISEKLSREPTPTLRTDRIDEVEEEEEEDVERPEPTSLDAVVATFDQIGLEDADEATGGEEEEEDYEEEEVEEEEFNRDYMIASYKQAMQEREQKLHQSSLLQTKLSDYFRRKKADQGGQAEASQETEKSITDQEQRYAKFLFNLSELRSGRDSKRQEFDDRIKELDLDCQSREEKVREQFQGLLDTKRKVGLKSVSATNGRPFPSGTQKRSDDGKAQDLMSTSVDDMMQEEALLEDQVVRVRLDNIGLGNRVRKCETALKAKEELSEGLHMIDFEQLKIENQTYNEKIEERQEELLKLKKKITNNVQVLTHLKEKLQFVQFKKQEQCEALDELDQTLSKRRDQLTRTKQIRDSLRNDNQRLKQNSGLLGNEALLRNFEDNVDLVTEKRDRLDRLKMEHSEMTLQCSKLKRKIDVARAQSAQ